MSMMDMSRQDKALAEAARVLKPGGFLQFSILHPCFAPPYRKVLRDDAGQIRAIEVGRYFDGIDGEIETWRFGAAPAEVKASVVPFRVPRFHRTLSEWVAMIVVAGLTIEHMAEPHVDAETARAIPYLADTHIVPLFLHIRARKGAASPARTKDWCRCPSPQPCLNRQRRRAGGATVCCPMACSRLPLS